MKIPHTIFWARTPTGGHLHIFDIDSSIVTARAYCMHIVQYIDFHASGTISHHGLDGNQDSGQDTHIYIHTQIHTQKHTHAYTHTHTHKHTHKLPHSETESFAGRLIGSCWGLVGLMFTGTTTGIVACQFEAGSVSIPRQMRRG